MRGIEGWSEEAGVSTDELMENAGLAVARSVRRMSGALTGVPIVVLVGPGNNGSDGLVTARHLRRWGARVTAYVCRDRPQHDPKLKLAIDAGVKVVVTKSDRGLAMLRGLLNQAHVVVDSILGTGRARPIEGRVREIMAALAAARRRRPAPRLLAMDLPTGLNCDSGEVDPAAVPADVTVSLGYPKVGHFGFPAAHFVGRLDFADIGIPAGLDACVDLRLMTEEWARELLPARQSDSHKGTHGRAMIVAGSRNFLGAAYLAATSATRVGAGLATIAIPESLVPSIASKAIEPTFLPLPESHHGVVSPDAADLILDSLGGYTALLVGCGLGQASETRTMVEGLLLSDGELPATAVDADGLNTMARVPRWWELWRDEAVLTPHPGEMARLTAAATGQTGSARLDLSRSFAKAWGKSVVLKGAHTVVADADGSAMVSPFANPGLATAGTGDVLAGAVSGLLSQGLGVREAAALGVYLHGLAGERAKADYGDTGMIASDLLKELPVVIRSLR